MFPRTRKTLRRRLHVHVQKGGARWQGVSDPTRQNEWIAALAGTKFEGLLPADKTFDTPASKSERLKLYFKTLEDIDSLFEIALGLIKKSRGITDSSSIVQSSSILSTPEAKKHAAEYLYDVVRFALFTDDRKIDDKAGPTKIQEILIPDAEPLPTILLYPKRLSNMLISTLSDIIVGFLEDDTLLRDVKTNLGAQPILATQLESYAQSYAYTYTARPLRDGFYIGQAIREFNEILMGEDDKGEKITQLVKDATNTTKTACKQILTSVGPKIIVETARAAGSTALRTKRTVDNTVVTSAGKSIDSIAPPTIDVDRISSELNTSKNVTGIFWIKFIEELVAAMGITSADQLFAIDQPSHPNCTNTLFNEEWAKLTARIYKFYKMKPDANQQSLLALLASSDCTVDILTRQEAAHELRFSPDREYEAAGVTVYNIPYSRLAKRMRTSTLQFILQLTFQIDEKRKAAAATVI